jgi:hypothetical protein
MGNKSKVENARLMAKVDKWLKLIKRPNLSPEFEIQIRRNLKEDKKKP